MYRDTEGCYSLKASWPVITCFAKPDSVLGRYEGAVPEQLMFNQSLSPVLCPGPSAAGQGVVRGKTGPGVSS